MDCCCLSTEEFEWVKNNLILNVDVSIKLFQVIREWQAYKYIRKYYNNAGHKCIVYDVTDGYGEKYEATFEQSQYHYTVLPEYKVSLIPYKEAEYKRKEYARKVKEIADDCGVTSGVCKILAKRVDLKNEQEVEKLKGILKNFKRYRGITPRHSLLARELLDECKQITTIKETLDKEVLSKIQIEKMRYNDIQEIAWFMIAK
jgi:hypothetical protein